MRKKILLLAVSVIVSISVLEIAAGQLRVAPEVISQTGCFRFVGNPNMVYELVPGSFDGANIMNQQGFNDTDFIVDKPENLIRVAMLGDSITQGVSVPAGKNFSGCLEKALNEAALDAGSALRFDVMNFGVGGYNLEAELEVLKEKVLPYKPDIVVLNLNSSDNEPLPGVNLMFSSGSTYTQEQKRHVLRMYLLERKSFFSVFERNVLYRSKLYLFMRNQIFNLRSGYFLTKLQDMESVRFTDMRSVYGSFAEIDRLRKQYGFKVLVCIHPSLLLGEGMNDEKFAGIAGTFRFYCFRMYPYYKKANTTLKALQLDGHPNDFGHPNEFGHSLIAKAMFSELTKNGFIAFDRKDH